MYILNFIRGFCMALADSVPGVSGGTVAFILGFYDSFVNALNNLISNDRMRRLKALKYLSKIGLGWIVGFILSVFFITSVFEKNIYKISSLFLGFIITSIPLIVKSEITTLINNKRNIIFLVIGIIVVGLITFLNPAKIGGNSLSLKFDNLTISVMVYIFLSGLIAISAMVLPGISGSTILLILGLYAPILNSVKEVIRLKLEYLPAITIFGLGILLGVLLTVRLVRYLLRTYRSQTIFFIIGLMIGSIYSVIMGPMCIEVSKSPMSIYNFKIVFFIIGCTLVPALEKLKKILKNKNSEFEIE